MKNAKIHRRAGEKGEVVGQANILYAGQVIGTVDLVAEKRPGGA